MIRIGKHRYREADVWHGDRTFQEFIVVETSVTRTASPGTAGHARCTPKSIGGNLKYAVSGCISRVIRDLWNSTLTKYGCRCLILILLAWSQTPGMLPAQEKDQEITLDVENPKETAKQAGAQADAETPAKVDAPADPNAANDTPRQQGNFLGRVLGRLFFGTQLSAETPETNGRERGIRNDPRAPFDAKLSTMLRKAMTHYRAKEVRQCADVLQKLLELPEDALWEEAPGQLISIRTAAQRLLAKLPAPEQERYRLQVGGTAQKEYQQAIDSGDIATLARVASRYLHTDAGYKAADHLASAYLDRGEFGLAAHWLNELWVADAPCTKMPAWRMKAEYVARKAPVTRLAKALKSQSATLPATATIGGKVVNSAEWLNGLTNTGLPQAPVLQDWLQFYGSAQRLGQAAAGEPLLMKRWSAPLTGSPPVQKLIDNLLNDLRDEHQVPILGFEPLLVHGKVVFRTLQGVQVVDAESGKLLWTTPDEYSPETLLSTALVLQNGSSNQDRNEAFGLLETFAEMFHEVEELPASDHPLTHLLYRNANYGLLSSDGRRVFVIEDQSILTNLQPGRYLGEEFPELDALGRPLGVNRLTAYDLQSGRSVWEAGGAQMHDPFELPLAGTFLFGPPVFDGDDLFLINESDGEIRLQVLDPETGLPRWSQLIARSQAKIQADIGRQWFTAQVAVADGVIICPTTVGWLVAVDRTTRSILWAHRYESHQDEPHDPEDEAVQESELSERWVTAPPVIAGNRVISTPAESQTIVCLGLTDGQVLWQQPRSEQTLYLAGVFGNQAVLVGTKSIFALDIENRGRTLWTVKFPAKDARPAGRGIAVQNQYYLPLTNGELLCVDLALQSKAASQNSADTDKTGTKPTTSPSTQRIVSRLPLPVSNAPELQHFGNLAMYRGMLLSLGTHGMVAFEPKLSIEQDLRQQLAVDPQSASAILRKSELAAVNQRHREALDLLHQLSGRTLAPELQQRYREASVTALSALVRQDLRAGDVEFEELSHWATLPTEIQAKEILKAERLIARQEWIAAFEVYVSFARTFENDLISPQTNGTLQVRGIRWAAAQLDRLWRNMSEESRQVLNAQVQKLAQTAILDPIEAQTRFINLFGFHPSANLVRRRLSEALIQQESWQAAEDVLTDLERDPAERPWALERLGRLWRQLGLESDAAYAYQVLEREYPDVRLEGDLTAPQLVANLRQAGQLAEFDPRPVVSWQNRDLELSRSGSNFEIDTAGRAVAVHGSALPYFKRHRVQFQPQNSRLEVVDVTNEKRVWSIPIRGSEDGVSGLAASRLRGHGIVTLVGGFVTALSPLDKKVLWTQSQLGRVSEIDESTYIEDGVDGAQGLVAEPLQRILNRTTRSREMANPWAVFGSEHEHSMVANQRYVSYVSRRHLVVLDAQTGQLLWERRDLPVAAVIRGGPQVIYVYDPRTEMIAAYSAVDGSRLEISKLDSVAKFAVDLVGDDFIRVAEKYENGKRQPSGALVERFDPLNQTSVWQVVLPPDAKIAPIPGSRLVNLNRDGQLQVCDLATGKLQTIGQLPAKPAFLDAEVRVIPTFEQFLVVVNPYRGFPRNYFPEAIPSLQVNGTVYAFDSITGKEQWHQKVDGMYMIVDRLDYSPILLFSARQHQQNQATNWKLNLKAIDRFGGKIVHTSSTFVQVSFHILLLDAANQFVEFRTYNDRIRLAPRN